MQLTGMWQRLVVLSALWAAAAPVAGCKKKESKPEKELKPEARARPADQAAGRKPSGPAARGTPAGLAFPELKPVPPPKELADKLKPAEEKLAGKDWKARREGRKAITEILDANKKHAGLALYLSMHKDPYLVESSFKLWKELKEHKDLLPTMKALLKHRSDRIRGKVLSFFWLNTPNEQLKKVKPYIEYMLKDESCIIRAEALRVLMSHRSALETNVQKLATNSIKDDCPALQAEGADKLKATAKVDPSVKDRLLFLAEKSPLYQVQCQALKALGRLKVKKAEKLMIKGLTVEAGTAMVLYYGKPRSLPYTFNIRWSTMPACAARALSLLNGKQPLPQPLEEVRFWLEELSKKKLTPKPDKRLCIDKKHCNEKKEVCLKMRCVPFKRAVKAYWDYVRLDRCIKKPKDPPYKNLTSPARVRSGFGLHFMGAWKMREFLHKKNKKAYEKKHAEVTSKPCVKM